MSQLFNRFVNFIFLFVIVVGVSGCTALSKRSAPIRIAINAWPGYEFLYLAHEKGFYRELGLETEIVQFASLADARKAYETGQVDVIGTTLVEVLFARDNSKLNPRVFYVADYSDGADVIIAQKKFKNVKDLKGKKIAVEVGSVCIYALSRALELSNMSLDDITLVAMDQDTMQRALKENKVDAIVTYPPVSLEFLSNPKYNVVFTSKEIPFELVDVLVASESMFKERKSDLKNIVKAFEKAKTYAFSSGTDGMALMAKREGLSTEIFTAALTDGLVLVPFEKQKENYFANKRLQEITDKIQDSLKKSSQLKGENLSKDVAEWVAD